MQEPPCCFMGQSVPPVFALWNSTEGDESGKQETSRGRVPWSQGCAGCHAWHFTLATADERASVQPPLLGQLGPVWASGVLGFDGSTVFAGPGPTAGQGSARLP